MLTVILLAGYSVRCHTLALVIPETTIMQPEMPEHAQWFCTSPRWQHFARVPLAPRVTVLNIVDVIIYERVGVSVF